MKTLKRPRRVKVNPRHRDYTKMTTDELSAATIEYERENLSPPVLLRGEKLRRYRRAMARRGRPRIGKGSKAITVTLERELLSRADRAARQRHVSRSQLIAAALHAQLHRSNGRD